MQKFSFVASSINHRRWLLLAVIFALLLNACTTTSAPFWKADGSSQESGPEPLATATPSMAVFTGMTPTPDEPRILPTLRSDSVDYTVQAGDMLGAIARRYGVPLSQVVEANEIENADLLEPGQQLVIPPPIPVGPPTSFKVIPDSEMVYGPAAGTFDLQAFVTEKNGYLASYREEVYEVPHSGVEIIARIGREYSVNPRLLLAILEYQSGWVTKPEPDEQYEDYPIGLKNAAWKGLYKQLSWAANNLNMGYSLWRVNVISSFILADDVVVPAANTINAGTAGVQYMFSQLLDYSEWRTTVGQTGLFQTYLNFFGSPYDLAVDPLVVEGTGQPVMQLPFEPGDTWSFTGGPHGGWGAGSGWAAIDFGPPGEPKGCLQNDAWATAVADGLVVISENGMILQDLDDDGNIGTGWVVLYLHIESKDRVSAGTQLKAGDRIGHPSCEGGVAYAAHLHLARRYNGEWISADGSIPFNLDGWVSEGYGVEYNGYLRKGDQLVEAWDYRRDENQIAR
jgi:LysM repeat protein